MALGALLAGGVKFLIGPLGEVLRRVGRGGEIDGYRVLTTDAVARAYTEQSSGMDEVLKRALVLDDPESLFKTPPPPAGPRTTPQ